MLSRLLLLFILVPFVELVILLRVGAILHVGPTIGIIVATGLIGATLARRQGLRTVTRINAELTAGRMPASELADGALILLAGALLVTPGFLTDAFGLALLVPACRSRIRRTLVRYFKTKIVISGPGTMDGDAPSGPESPPFETGARPVRYVRNEALDDPSTPHDP
ncbi:MAG: FxsA family protein [Phycisphaerae bacterium]